MDGSARTRGPMRRSGIAAVLELVHRSGGLTRADLTARSGLNRSTIAMIVGELAAGGLIVEGDAPGERRVGRPSPLVTPAPEPVVVAANPELDAVDVALVGLGASVVGRRRVQLERVPTPSEAVAAIAQATRELVARHPGRIPLAAAVAVPGVVRPADGLVRWAPHLDWREVPFGAQVADAIGLPTVVANDANLGAIAEHRFGAGRGIDDLVYLNGGASGIGGGVIVRGELLAGADGYSGEFGQNRPGSLGAGDRRAGEGTVEDEVSRARVLAILGRAAADEAELDALLMAPTTPELAEELARQQRVLGVALANAVNVLNPRRIVLGGYLATLLRLDETALAAAVSAAAVPAAMEHMDLAAAELGDRRLLVGAAELAFAPILADPGSVSELSPAWAARSSRGR